MRPAALCAFALSILAPIALAKAANAAIYESGTVSGGGDNYFPPGPPLTGKPYDFGGYEGPYGTFSQNYYPLTITYTTTGTIAGSIFEIDYQHTQKAYEIYPDKTIVYQDDQNGNSVMIFPVSASAHSLTWIYDYNSFITYSGSVGGCGSNCLYATSNQEAFEDAYFTVFLTDSSEYTYTIDASRYEPTGSIPEPSTWSLILGGVAVAGVTLRNKRRMKTQCWDCSDTA